VSRLPLDDVDIDVFRLKINQAGKAAGELRKAIGIGDQVAIIVRGECVGLEVKSSSKDGTILVSVIAAEKAAIVPAVRAVDIFDELDEATRADDGQPRLPGMEASAGPVTEVHVDSDGSVLTPDEVADRQDVPVEAAGAPSLDEAQHWWEETYEETAGEYTAVGADELIALVDDVPLQRLDCLQVLEEGMEDPNEEVLAAIAARRARAAAIVAPSTAGTVGGAEQWLEDEAPFGVGDDGMARSLGDAVDVLGEEWVMECIRNLDLDGLAQLARLVDSSTPGRVVGCITNCRLFLEGHPNAAVPAPAPTAVHGDAYSAWKGTERDPLAEKLPIGDVRNRLDQVFHRHQLTEMLAVEESKSQPRKRVVTALMRRLDFVDGAQAPAAGVVGDSEDPFADAPPLPGEDD
jgi:hypothetical protein